jgi:hypothetical protein
MVPSQPGPPPSLTLSSYFSVYADRLFVTT